MNRRAPLTQSPALNRPNVNRSYNSPALAAAYSGRESPLITATSLYAECSLACTARTAECTMGTADVRSSWIRHCERGGCGPLASWIALTVKSFVGFWWFFWGSVYFVWWFFWWEENFCFVFGGSMLADAIWMAFSTYTTNIYSIIASKLLRIKLHQIKISRM